MATTRICTDRGRNLHRGRSHAPEDMATVVVVAVAAEIHIVAAPAGVATVPQVTDASVVAAFHTGSSGSTARTGPNY